VRNIFCYSLVPKASLIYLHRNSNHGSNQKAPRGTQAVRRNSKSTAADLPTRIHEDITNGHYECVICTNEVLRNSRVWSCSICWTVAHMSCVKKWYSNRVKNADPQQQDGWRCPGCNSSLVEEPTTYHCWCGKEVNPTSVPGLSPHSCGQTCSKPRGTCPHPCPLECHAGPCPPCLMMGPSQSCFCGKNTSTKRCGETDYQNGWSCHQPCGDLLACGEHECRRECHSGLCGNCDILMPSICYCGRETKEIPCDERGDKLESHYHGQNPAILDIPPDDELPKSYYWGTFKCDSTCGRPFDCGKHYCQKECHPQDEVEAHCPFSPDLVTHCPCGKTALDQVLERPRSSCEDPVPSCDKKCGRLLPCREHPCDRTCHLGSCGPCMQKMEISCRCRRTKSSSVCHQGAVYAPECMKVCRAQLNCGRHEHGEHCCPGEKKAMERVAAKRKNKITSSTNEEFEAEHICVRVCGRDLKCGRHKCQQMCHRGPCPSCLEAIFEEISCHCGRTVLQPPQPCGTQPPECRFDCTRSRPCGHPQVSSSSPPPPLPAC
jgi:transcriptional repressor NF-X1